MQVDSRGTTNWVEESNSTHINFFIKSLATQQVGFAFLCFIEYNNVKFLQAALNFYFDHKIDAYTSYTIICWKMLTLEQRDIYDDNEFCT